MVLNQRDLSTEEELTTDLLAILTAFGARVNGLRRYHKEIKEDKTLPGRAGRGLRYAAGSVLPGTPITRP